MPVNHESRTMADPRDIVARLRQLALVAEHEIDRSAFEEAADEIERLRADLARVTAERGAALFREGKACVERDKIEEELEAVREECQHEREAKVAAQLKVEDRPSPW